MPVSRILPAHPALDGSLWKFIAAIVFALVYLIAPVDVIPDFIPLVGYIDDTAVFGLLLAGFRSDIDAYRRWKESQQ